MAKPRTTDLIVTDLRIDANTLDRAGMPEIAARVREAIVRLEASARHPRRHVVTAPQCDARWHAAAIASGEIDGMG